MRLHFRDLVPWKKAMSTTRMDNGKRILSRTSSIGPDRANGAADTGVRFKGLKISAPVLIPSEENSQQTYGGIHPLAAAWELARNLGSSQMLSLHCYGYTNGSSSSVFTLSSSEANQNLPVPASGAADKDLEYEKQRYINNASKKNTNPRTGLPQHHRISAIKSEHDEPKAPEGTASIKRNIKFEHDKPKAPEETAPIKKNVKFEQDKPKAPEEKASIKNNFKFEQDKPKAPKETAPIKKNVKFEQDKPKATEEKASIKGNDDELASDVPPMLRSCYFLSDTQRDRIHNWRWHTTSGAPDEDDEENVRKTNRALKLYRKEPASDINPLSITMPPQYLSDFQKSNIQNWANRTQPGAPEADDERNLQETFNTLASYQNEDARPAEQISYREVIRRRYPGFPTEALQVAPLFANQTLAVATPNQTSIQGTEDRLIRARFTNKKRPHPTINDVLLAWGRATARSSVESQSEHNMVSGLPRRPWPLRPLEEIRAIESEPTQVIVPQGVPVRSIQSEPPPVILRFYFSCTSLTASLEEKSPVENGDYDIEAFGLALDGVFGLHSSDSIANLDGSQDKSTRQNPVPGSKDYLHEQGSERYPGGHIEHEIQGLELTMPPKLDSQSSNTGATRNHSQEKQIRRKPVPSASSRLAQSSQATHPDSQPSQASASQNQSQDRQIRRKPVPSASSRLAQSSHDSLPGAAPPSTASRIPSATSSTGSFVSHLSHNPAHRADHFDFALARLEGRARLPPVTPPFRCTVEFYP